MATKHIQRASVRLRIERGTALITNLGGEPISCDLAEISLSGCKCRIPLIGTAEDIISAWRLILVPGRILSLKFSAPAEFTALSIPSAEVRWVDEPDPQAIFFGLSFGGLSPEQSLMLSTNLMTLASSKLRVKREPPPVDAQPETTNGATETAPPPAEAESPAPQPAAIEASAPPEKEEDIPYAEPVARWKNRLLQSRPKSKPQPLPLSPLPPNLQRRKSPACRPYRNRNLRRA